MRYIKHYKGFKIGDKVRITFANQSHEDGCEILEMYETTAGRVRICCKIRRAAKIEVDSIWVVQMPQEAESSTNPGACSCDISTLMASGCLCGGE